MISYKNNIIVPIICKLNIKFLINVGIGLYLNSLVQLSIKVYNIGPNVKMNDIVIISYYQIPKEILSMYPYLHLLIYPFDKDYNLLLKYLLRYYIKSKI